MKKILSERLKKVLFCPKCNSRFRIVKDDPLNRSAVIECRCNHYPVIEDIVFLSNNRGLNNKIIFLIGKNEFNKALSLLIAFNRPSSFFFKYFPDRRSFYKSLGFDGFLNLLKLLGYPQDFARYLKHREEIPSFYISRLSLSLITQVNKKVVELGCGTGNLAPYVYNRIKPENHFCLDSNFLSLFIARLFFVKEESLVICSDLEKGVPIINNSVDFVQMTDAFQYIHHRNLLLSEIKRILVKKGMVTVIHTVNKPDGRRGLGISPKEMKQLIKGLFNENVFIPHRYVLSSISSGKDVVLKSKPINDEDHAYNVFLSQSKLPPRITIEKKYQQHVKNISKGPFDDLI